MDHTGNSRRRQNARRKQGRGGGGLTLLRACADYVAEDGARRASFSPGATNWSRGVDVDSSFSRPWFGSAVGSAKSLFGEVDSEGHLDNSAVRIYSADFNPGDRRNRRGILFGALRRYATPRGSGWRRRNGRPSQRRPARPIGGRSGHVPHDGFRGARTENFLKSRKNGRLVERTPPYIPEIRPIELARNCLKTAYNTRYDNSAHVSDFLIEFPSRSPKAGLRRLCAAQTTRRETRIARRNCISARRHGASCSTECERDGDPEMGIANAGFGEMWG